MVSSAKSPFHCCVSYLECTLFYYIHRVVQLSRPSNFRTFLFYPKESSVIPHFPPATPSPWQPLINFLSLWIFLLLGISYKWNYTICGPLWLVSSPSHNVSKVHLCGICSQDFIPFYGSTILHYMDRPHIAYPVITWWIFGLFHFFNYYEVTFFCFFFFNLFFGFFACLVGWLVALVFWLHCVACGILVQGSGIQGWNQCPLQGWHRFLSTGLLGKSLSFYLLWIMFPWIFMYNYLFE